MEDPWFRELRPDEQRAFWLGYVMGLVAGEGSFTHGGWGERPALQVRLHARDPQPLRDLVLHLGGRLYGPYHIRGKRFADWRLYGAALRTAIPIFLRHLPRSHKRGQFLAWAVEFGLIPFDRAEAEGIFVDD